MSKVSQGMIFISVYIGYIGENKIRIARKYLVKRESIFEIPFLKKGLQVSKKYASAYFYT